MILVVISSFSIDHCLGNDNFLLAFKPEQQTEQIFQKGNKPPYSLTLFQVERADLYFNTCSAKVKSSQITTNAS